MILNDIIKIRKHIHKNPELSGDEVETSKFIINKLNEFGADKVLSNIGMNGVIGIFKGKSDKGKSVLFRAEMDAVNVHETSNHEHKSNKLDISHTCGHDGHMAILLAFASELKQIMSTLPGEVILFFQESEETGQGAKNMIKDTQFKHIEPDFCFAMHNLPQFEKKCIIVKENIMSAASKGVNIKLTGESSHAAKPYEGVNPKNILIQILEDIDKISEHYNEENESSYITTTFAQLGTAINYGITPGNALIAATMRSQEQKIIDQISDDIKKRVIEICNNTIVNPHIEWVEEFPGVNNNINCVNIIRDSAKDLNLKIHECNFPFNWSEDFSYITQKFPGALFGIGAGLDHPFCHNPEYDFPDDIIETSLNMYKKIIQKILRPREKEPYIPEFL